VKWKNFLLLVLLAALWGPSFLFIKVAVADIPPLTLVLGRVGLGALVLYAVLRWQGRNLPPFGSVWKHLAFAGLVQNAIPFVLFSWGEQYIASALASILNGTTPIFTIILAHFFVADERLTAAKVTGVLMGMGGLLFLIAPSLAGGIQATTWGLVAVTAATFCYGVAIVKDRTRLRD
jgi:drug/metabolite transporter (DMT)-like permease